jgi:hypothetical protein
MLTTPCLVKPSSVLPANTYSQQYELRNFSFITVSCNYLMSVCMCFVVIVRYTEFCSGTGTDKTHIVSQYKCLENNAGCEKQRVLCT